MKCSFCGNNIKPGTGKMLVKLDGTILMWCSSKCGKNYSMGRSKKLKWARPKKEV